jgi:NAD(P)H dehydrogenase (quinone)
VAEASGKPITYQNMPPESFRAEAMKAGVPEMFAMILSDTDAGVAKGALSESGSGRSVTLISSPS